MERLNRELLRVLLNRLADRYPEWATPEEIGIDGDGRDWTFGATYLAEHELIRVSVAEFIGAPRRVDAAAITAKGLDFLQDDGGLTAILGVVTVRFDAETLRALVLARAEALEATPEQKGAIRTALGTMSSEGLKALTKSLVEKGLQHAPDLLQLLQTLRS